VFKNGILNLTFVTFVVVMDAHSPLDPNLKKQIEEIAIILIREEFRDRFLSKQSFLILQAKQEKKKSGEKMDKILSQSILATHIRDIFNAFRDGLPMTINLNSWIPYQMN
jgi:hypothetical protein